MSITRFDSKLWEGGFFLKKKEIIKFDFLKLFSHGVMISSRGNISLAVISFTQFFCGRARLVMYLMSFKCLLTGSLPGIWTSDQAISSGYTTNRRFWTPVSTQPVL